MHYARSEAKAAAREQVRGIWAAMTTPFGSNGEVDLPALRADTRHLVEELAVDGIFCAGVMAEFWALTVAERRRVVETVVDEVAGRCGVVAHTGHHSAREAIELTRHAEAAGADFAVLLNPYYPRVEEAGLYEWFTEVTSAVDLGIWLFDTSYAGFALSLELIDRLAEIENVCGIKVGHGHERFLAVLDRVGDRIVASEPDEGRWLENLLDHGVQVFMSSAAPYLLQTAASQPMRDYTAAALAGDRAEANAISSRLEPLRAISERFITGPWRSSQIQPISAIKRWSSRLGLAGGPVRAPLSALTEAQESELDGQLAEALDACGLTPATVPAGG